MDKYNTDNEHVNLPKHVEQYISKGWEAPLPLPEGQKYPPITGSTGRIPRLEPEAVRSLWENRTGKANCAVRMQVNRDFDIIAIDVDQYDSKQGKDNLVELMETLGELPLHKFPRSTRRGVDADAAQFFFKVPKDMEWNASVCADVEVVQFKHRYSAVWPSVVDGDQYKWYLGDEEIDIPHVDDLPTLPERWVEYLKRTTRPTTGVKADERAYSDALKWLESRAIGGESAFPLEVVWIEGCRHDAMNDKVWNLVSGALYDGHSGLLSSLKKLRKLYLEVVGEHRDFEFKKSVVGAVALAEGAIDSGEKEDFSWKDAGDFALPNFPDLITPKGWDGPPDDEASQILRGLTDEEANMIAALPDDEQEVVIEHLLEQSRSRVAALIEEEKAVESPEERLATSVAAIEDSFPEDYWAKYPSLKYIADVAKLSSLEKYAVVFRAASYLSAQMPPATYLENFKQPLTQFSAVIAESGAGKGYLDEVADALIGDHPTGPEGQKTLRMGTGNVHTLLTEFGDFEAKVKREEDIPVPKRMLVKGNELASWAEMQGNLEWEGILADVFDGSGQYNVRNDGHKYNFGIDQHSLGVAFSVQPDAAHYLFDSVGRGLPGRFLVSVLPKVALTLPEEMDPWDLNDGIEVSGFDPSRDVKQLKINPRYLHEDKLFYLSPDAAAANKRLRAMWDQNHPAYRGIRAEKIFSQMPKNRLRLATLLKVLLDLGEGHEVPLEALKMADCFMKVSMENTRYARTLAVQAERQGNAAVAAGRKRADVDSDLKLAKENILEVIDKAKNKRAGLVRINDRKKATAEHHEVALAQLVAGGVLKEVVHPSNNKVSYCRI